MKTVREKTYGRRVVSFEVVGTPSEKEIRISRNMGFEVSYNDGKVSVTGGNPHLVKRLEAIRSERASL